MFDDGDCGDNIGEHLVQSPEEYKVQQKYEANLLGTDLGIRNYWLIECGGRFEKVAGWWKCSESDKIYLTLIDLIREQDNAIIECKPPVRIN